MSTRSDARGYFRMCGLPVNTALIFRAENDSLSAAPVEARINEGQRFLRVELAVSEPLVATASFRGTVTDSASFGIADAEVTLPALGLTTRTDTRGAFNIPKVIAGPHRVIVRRLGYGALDTSLALERGNDVDRRIVLTRITLLDSVVSTTNRSRDPGLEAFAENRRMGFGQFVTKEEILTREGSLLSSFLQQMRGARVMTSPGGDYVAGGRAPRCLSGRATGRDQMRSGEACVVYYVPSLHEEALGVRTACYAKVYLDNQLMNPGTPTPPFNLRHAPPTQVEAMEFYAGASQLPKKYMGLNSLCGLLVIHTRRPP